ncbi:MAG TPA: hypothetical protein VJ912_03300 [Candidatus Nanoarchaeia archaeon]|nr:hypothetical protein [Candidatus Nanoarchaeia archaeon]
MVQFFKKKCSYCGEKIEKGKEIWEYVKLPEFTTLKIKPFCSKDHAQLFKLNIVGTPARSSCPNCKE